MSAAARHQELNGPDLGPAGQGVRRAPAPASGLLWLVPVEVVPSHVAVVLPVPIGGGLVWFGRPHSVCDGETTVVSS